MKKNVSGKVLVIKPKRKAGRPRRGGPTLSKRGQYWYIVFGHNNRQSTGETDEKRAQAVLNAVVSQMGEKEIERLHRHESITLEQFRAEYLEYCRDLEPASIVSYDGALKKLIEFLGAGTRLRTISRATIEDFKQWALNGDNSDGRKNSVNTYLRGLSVAFNYAMVDSPDDGKKPYMDRNPIARGLYGRGVYFTVNRRVKKNMTQEEIDRIFSRIDSEIVRREGEAAEAQQPIGKKRVVKLARIRVFRHLLVLALHTGMRREEIARLRWNEVDIQRRRILVKDSKTHVDDYVPLTDDAIRALEAIGVRDIGYVFGEFYLNGASEKSAIVTISALFTEFARMAGVDATMHSTRHCNAKWLADKGVPATVIQRILRHSRLETTLGYIDHTFDDAERAIQKLNKAFGEY